ncbi:MAG: hypothetical protein U0176_04165 [Bacteroidia bacterium]
MELARSGDKITGTFENTDDQTELELRGTINGEYLRLEEFAEKDKLTGIFDGKYDGEEYLQGLTVPIGNGKCHFSFRIMSYRVPMRSLRQKATTMLHRQSQTNIQNGQSTKMKPNTASTSMRGSP